MSGRVVHFEVPFDDGDRARGFYKEIFGWQLQTMPEMGGYTMVMSGPSGDTGPDRGRLHQRRHAVAGPGRDARPGRSSSTSTASTTSLEKIGGLGGSTVVGKTPVGDMGFAAYFKDPEGNVMGLWETAKSS